MVRKLIEWALNSALVVILLALALAAVGIYAFRNVNVEAYPDPAPAIIEVVAQYPGYSAEEVERLVTIPLEIALAGMPGLTYTRSKSLAGLSHLRNQFDYGVDYYTARQEVINRLSFVQSLPANVSAQISPFTPTGELIRYTLNSPRNAAGRDIYSLTDLKALQDWTLEREFKRIKRIADVSSFGGMVKRYEVWPDPDRLKRYGITVQQFQNAVANSNSNVGAGYLSQGPVAMNVRGIGVLGRGRDPAQRVLGTDKQVVDAYEDACLAEALHVLAPGQRGDFWQVLAEERLAAHGKENGVRAGPARPLPAEGERRVRAVERLRRGADGKELAPPAGPEEQRQIDLFRRLRAAVAGRAVTPSLSPEEQALVTAARRVAAGFTFQAVEPPLTDEEDRQVHALRRWVATRAARALREEDLSRVREVRDVVVASVNNVPVRVEDLVTGGPGEPGVSATGGGFSHEGVFVGHQPRLGKIGVSRPRVDVAGREVRDADGALVWVDEEDMVQGIVLMRKNEATLLALRAVKAKVDELNTNPGRLLPGVHIVPHFDLTGLIHVTTETVQENLLLGMGLVTVILLMFLSSVRSALIVAVNIPLALLFAFSVLFFRGKSANLLSIGAVDFGIIVDSSVIMVENIYRHLSSGEYAELPLKERIIRACHEVERPLFFSTAVMVCAFIPLFTMQGPEGQIFSPMADTYAFALGGALVLALTVSPVLCLLFFKNLRPSHDNRLVRWLKASYLRQLNRCLNHRALTLGLFAFLIVGTAGYVVGAEYLVQWGYDVPHLGREFMPELEEGNLYVRGTLPVNVSPEEAADQARRARALMRSYPEVALVASQMGRPDDATDPCGFYNVEFSLPLRPEKEWPALVPATGWRRWLGLGPRSRLKSELIRDMNEDLNRHLPGVDWNFSQYIRDNVMEALSGIKGDNSVKIIGPDLAELEKLADATKMALRTVRGVENVGIFHITGQPNLDITVDRARCKFWNVQVADVENAIKIAVGGQAVTQMIEGEKTFDITLRWPERLRGSERAILDIPVDVTNNVVTPGWVPGVGQTPVTGPSVGVSTIGTTIPMPSLLGNVFNAAINNIASVPRLRLSQLVTPVNKDGVPDPNGTYLRPGASTIYREQGKRLIAIKFSVRGRDLAGAVAEAQEVVAPLIPTPYTTEWSGEFQEMKEAEARLFFIIPVSLALIFALLYLAFHDLVDALLVFSNVVALSLGGVWALLLTQTNFSISAAVGFVSIFGVAIMDGLLLVSYFNHLRAQGLPLREAILQGAEKRVRPVMMTALAAVFGLLPAAVSTRIGAQTQRPLAIVVVGGMVTTLFLTRYLMPVLYSFYGHREPPSSAGGLAH
jgi:cobalt-zinc-cadmium resistance protein CzcA